MRAYHIFNSLLPRYSLAVHIYHDLSLTRASVYSHLPGFSTPTILFIFSWPHLVQSFCGTLWLSPHILFYPSSFSSLVQCRLISLLPIVYSIATIRHQLSCVSILQTPSAALIPSQDQSLKIFPTRSHSLITLMDPAQYLASAFPLLIQSLAHV